MKLCKLLLLHAEHKFDLIQFCLFLRGQFFRALEQLIKNGGDPFQRNKKEESIESYLNDIEGHESLKLLIQESKGGLSTEGESPIHRAIEDNKTMKLHIYRVLGANFYAFNNKGERPLEVAINLGDVDIVLFVLHQSQILLEEDTMFDRVVQFLASQILQQNINVTHVHKYKELWRNVIVSGAKRRENFTALLGMVPASSKLLHSELLKLLATEI